MNDISNAVTFDALKSLKKTARMPVLFLGHGSPMNAIEDNEYRRSWQALGAEFAAHFSDRGHLFQADRGRRFRAIVDAQGMRASEYLMYITHQTCFMTGVAKRFG